MILTTTLSHILFSLSYKDPISVGALPRYSFLYCSPKPKEIFAFFLFITGLRKVAKAKAILFVRLNWKFIK